LITEIQTYAFDIRDAFFNVVTADPFFAGYTKRKNKMRPVQQNLIPYLGVYLLPETTTPDGDANAGCIRFTHTVPIGFSAIVANSDPDVAEATADQAMQRIMVSAYTDLHLFNVLNNSNPDGVGIEGLSRGTRRTNFGVVSTDNEMPFCEAQYEVGCTFRTEWYPDITDTLDEIDVTTGVKPGDTQTEMDQRQQVAVVYDFTALRQQRKPLRKPWLLARDQRRK
jgi:hypothetical protein